MHMPRPVGFPSIFVRLVTAVVCSTAALSAFAAENNPDDLQHYLASAFSCEQIASELIDRNSFFQLAYLGEKAVGYTKLKAGEVASFVRGPRPVELMRIYLDQKIVGKEHRRRGVGGSSHHPSRISRTSFSPPSRLRQCPPAACRATTGLRWTPPVVSPCRAMKRSCMAWIFLRPNATNGLELIGRLHSYQKEFWTS